MSALMKLTYTTTTGTIARFPFEPGMNEVKAPTYREASQDDCLQVVEVSDDGLEWSPAFYIGRSLFGLFITQDRFSKDLKSSGMSRVLIEN